MKKPIPSRSVSNLVSLVDSMIAYWKAIAESNFKKANPDSDFRRSPSVMREPVAFLFRPVDHSDRYLNSTNRFNARSASLSINYVKRPRRILGV
jgi:hypothetical protein